MKLSSEQRKASRQINAKVCSSLISISSLSISDRKLLLDSYIQGVHRFVTEETRLAIINREANKCFYCNAAFNKSQSRRASIDHVIAKSTAKTLTQYAKLNLPSNLLACCNACNTLKGTLSISLWHSKMITLGLTTETLESLKTRLDATLKTQIVFKQIPIQKILGVKQ